MTPTPDLWDLLTGLQDELENAQFTRPNRVGSEMMARDEAAGNALPALLAVVEAAACYREAQRRMKINPGLGAADRKRAQTYLDECLAVFGA